MTTIIDLIRHGEPEGGSRYRGHGVDDVLSNKGWQQMWHAVGNACYWEAIISSPLKRCQEFAQALADKNERPLEVIDALKEVGFGTWEGRCKDEIKLANAAEFNAFYADPVHARPEGAEDLQQFSHRVNQAYQQICIEYADKQVLVVAHAGVIRALVAQQIGASLGAIYQLQIDHAGLTRLENTRLPWSDSPHPDTQYNSSQNRVIYLNRRLSA